MNSACLASDELRLKFGKVLELVTELLPKIHDISKEELGDLVDQEMHNTSQAIENAVAKLEVRRQYFKTRLYKARDFSVKFTDFHFNLKNLLDQ